MKLIAIETETGKRYTINEALCGTKVVKAHKVLDAINALPVKYPFTPDWPPDEAIRETIKERDDALKEVERLTAQLALAEKVMLNLAKILCTPRYDRGDGCGDERKLLASYGWTKEKE